MDFNYKKYSLEKLEEWMYDVLSNADTSPHEIYAIIRKVVQDEYNYHKEQSQRCLGLLELLSGHRPVNLQCDKDDPSPECKGAWGDFWSQVENHDQMIDDGYEMTDDGFWIPPQKEDKVKKWQLPVEETQIGETDETEYFITFPDDLLEAANLKEGDQVEWIDNEDGSFELRKVNGTK